MFLGKHQASRWCLFVTSDVESGNDEGQGEADFEAWILEEQVSKVNSVGTDSDNGGPWNMNDSTALKELRKSC